MKNQGIGDEGSQASGRLASFLIGQKVVPASFLQKLSVVPWVRYLDLALLVVALLMVTTDATVLLFHIVFVLLSIGAFFWPFRSFVLRTSFWVTVDTAYVLEAVFIGKTQGEELIEIPLLTTILVLVFTIAGRRAMAEKQVRVLNTELEQRVMELDVTNQELKQTQIQLIQAAVEYKQKEEALLRARVAEAAKQEMETEITERKRVEQALRESQRRLSTLINTLPGIVFSCANDSKWSMTYLSEGCLSLTGYRGEELLENGMFSYKDIIHPGDLPKVLDAIKAAIAREQPYVVEYRISTKRGQEKWLWEKGSGVFDSNSQLLGLEGFITDITERKQAEEDIHKTLKKEQELSELKSQFITTTSHEFRTPLSTILSSAELLRKYSHKLNEAEKHQHLQRIQATVQNMTQLLSDVLLIGKAEAGKLEFKPTPLNLAQFCRDLVEEIQVSTSTHTITFCSQGQGSIAHLDEKLLRHIFSNLLSNAIKYSPQGGTIHFDLLCQPGEVIFQIQDDGIGIPAADQTKLFDAFHRASNVSTISGTGLGLAIAKKAVDLHGGKITVTSEVGVGTTFTVSIPLDN